MVPVFFLPPPLSALAGASVQALWGGTMLSPLAPTSVFTASSEGLGPHRRQMSKPGSSWKVRRRWGT